MKERKKETKKNGKKWKESVKKATTKKWETHIHIHTNKKKKKEENVILVGNRNFSCSFLDHTTLITQM